VNIQTASPEFFYFANLASGANPVAAINSITGAYIGPDQLLPGATFVPAKPGDYITVFATGFGDTFPLSIPGKPASEAAPVTRPVLVKLNGVSLTQDQILYAGVTPGFQGLYQLNIRIPDSAPSGDLTLQMQIDSYASPAGPYLHVVR